MHVCLNGLHWAIHDQLDPHRRGEVVHDIGLVHELRKQGNVRGGVDHVGEPRALLQVPHVLDRAGREVVQHGHVVPAPKELFRQVASDEAGTPGYQVAHIRVSPSPEGSGRGTRSATDSELHGQAGGQWLPAARLEVGRSSIAYFETCRLTIGNVRGTGRQGEWIRG